MLPLSPHARGWGWWGFAAVSGAWLSPGPMEESDEDGEDNEEFLERLMVQTGREIPQRELEEHYAVLEELGSGSYGRVVLTEPRDGGEGLWEEGSRKGHTAAGSGKLLSRCAQMCTAPPLCPTHSSQTPALPKPLYTRPCLCPPQCPSWC